MILELETWSFQEALTFLKISKENVRKKLYSLNPSKAAGPDGIHPRILKELYEELARPLN